MEGCKGGFLGDSDGKEPTCNAGDLRLIPGQRAPQEKGTATRASVLAWRIPWTEEPGVVVCVATVLGVTKSWT